jgi:Transglycosylase SLT domain
MKRTHYLIMTFIAFFLSLSFLAMFFTGVGKNGQDPWMSDLHPPRLGLLTPSFFSIFPFPLPSTPFIESQTSNPETPPLQGQLSPSIESPEEAPMLFNEELDENQQYLHFDETEGTYFGQYAPKTRRLLSISGKKKIQKQVEEAAMEIGVDPRLAKAMAAVESGYDRKAVSPQGAIGVLQLMPRFFCRDNEITPEMLFDPDINIRVGLTHFKSLLDKFNENVDLSLAAYNAGAKRVIDAGHTIPALEQTQNYIRKVKEAMDREDLDRSSLDQS